jgi:spore maturation protein SpmA
MEDLESLNPRPGIATNAMCMFLTVNTAGVQLIPASMVGLMASAGSKDPTAIIGTTFAATAISLVFGLAAVKVLEKLPIFSVEESKK